MLLTRTLNFSFPINLVDATSVAGLSPPTSASTTCVSIFETYMHAY